MYQTTIHCDIGPYGVPQLPPKEILPPIKKEDPKEDDDIVIVAIDDIVN